MNDALTSVAVAAGQVDADLALGVREVIAKALGQSLDAVELQHNLVDELGAESLDFLDIVFELEDRFDVEITRGALEQAARGGMQDEAGLERLRSLLPEAAQRIEAGLRPREIPRLFSVLTFARVVAAQLESRAISGKHP
jgi:acyl carrier protein